MQVHVKWISMRLLALMFHMAYTLQINGEFSPHIRKHGNDIETLENIPTWYCFLNV